MLALLRGLPPEAALYRAHPETPKPPKPEEIASYFGRWFATG